MNWRIFVHLVRHLLLQHTLTVAMFYSCPLQLFFFNLTAPTDIYTLSLHDALPISRDSRCHVRWRSTTPTRPACRQRSEEHTSELQSRPHLVCRLLLEKKKIQLILHLTKPDIVPLQLIVRPISASPPHMPSPTAVVS